MDIKNFYFMFLMSLSGVLGNMSKKLELKADKLDGGKNGE